jgi:hypothetical protein
VGRMAVATPAEGMREMGRQPRERAAVWSGQVAVEHLLDEVLV